MDLLNKFKNVVRLNAQEVDRKYEIVRAQQVTKKYGLAIQLCIKEECQYCKSTGLVKIMLTLMDYFSPADRRTSWVTD
jgi:hypothetical protein